MSLTTTARLRVALAAAVALFLLAVLPGAALAQQGDITQFRLQRVNSNPEFAFVPGAGAFATLVASPLGYPAAVGPVIGLGNDNCTTAGVVPVHVFPTGQVTPNTVADDCDAFLRIKDGRHEDSPGAFPGLEIEADFDPATPPKTLTVKPPEGQLGNPFAAHQCAQSDEERCAGWEPAFDPVIPPIPAVHPDDDQTEADGAKVGNVTFVTNGPTCPKVSPNPNIVPGVDGCAGEVLNYDPRALDNEDERGAPAAQALVVCAGLKLSTPATFCAGTPRPKIFSEAGPIDIVPSEEREGDYQLSSTIDFTQVENLAPGEQVIGVLINQFGLVLQEAADPRQDPNPNDEQAALPFIFNPTACITAVARADATFFDDTSDEDTYQTFPDPNDAAPDDNERAFVEEECEGYPWDHREVDPERSTPGPTQPPHDVETREMPDNPGGPQADPPPADQPPGFDGTTAVTFNAKIGENRIDSPTSLAVRVLTPTRGGLEYQSHYREVSVDLQAVTLNAALAGRPGFTICTPEQFDRGAFEAAECPDGSQIGDLEVLSGLADGDLGPVPCHDAVTFSDCSKVNPFVVADRGCAEPDEEAPCDNLSRHYDGPASWAATGGDPGASLDPIPGEVWAGPQVEGHPNQFRVFAEIRNSPTCEPNPPTFNPVLCQDENGDVVEDVKPRLHVKLEGVATADLETGAIHAVFDDLPELPVLHVEQAFPGGDFAPFVTRDIAGDFKIPSEIIPWASFRGDGDVRASDPPPAEPDDTITLTAPSGLKAFAPQLTLLADPMTAAQDTSLTTKITVPDGGDLLTSVDRVSLPDGLLGVLNSVPMCGHDLARAGTCPAESQIGTVDVAVGSGGVVHTQGKVYFSQPGAEGEIARITVVLPAKAGPFDLQQTVINELAVKLRINGTSIGLDNVGVDKLPTIISGIPIRVREINLTIDHPAFLRNPVTCNTQPATAQFSSKSGQVATVTTQFTPTGCESLAFTPKLTATVGSADQPVKVGGHPPLTTVVTQPDHQAVIRKAVVSLPNGLFANVAALQSLCTIDQAANNACPETSLVGSAKAVSPLVPTPLTGSVFIAENPSGGLPRLVMRLSNELLAVPLEATTTLAGSRLVTTLDNLPAAPVTSFELTINGGPKGLFTVGNALCTGAIIDSSFESHTGQSTTDSSPANLVGSCTPVPGPAAAAKPSLSVSVRRLAGRAPLMTMRARSANGAAKLRSVRLVLPSKLAFNRAALKRGVAITANGKRLKGSSWSLSRSGVLTIKAAKKGSTVVTATIQSGALRSSSALKKLVRGRKALPRMAFTGRVTDVKNARYGYTLKVRPVR